MPVLSERRVKIVSTLGPATQTPEMISALISAGMDVARLNFSHGTHAFHQGLFQNIRKASKDLGRNVAIMQDLQGPKLRAGKLPAEGVMLKPGDIVLLYPEGTTPKLSTTGRIPIPISAEIAEPISKDIVKGARILFDDGKIRTWVKEVSPPEIVVEVEYGGKLKSQKGMNLPGTPLSIPCLTDKDLKDLHFGLQQGVDAVALSFVRSEKDIEQIKEIIKKNSNFEPLVVAKIERAEAIEDIDPIIEVTDGILIARGDMAVEIGPERVPVVQKQLIRSCNELGVPVITATQMLESMVSSPTPTRAEASDVANAVFDGTDAVMLSAETASGDYPAETVKMMVKIILGAENAVEGYSTYPGVQPLLGSIVDSIEFSAAKIAYHTGAAAIVCVTHSGMAARTVSKYRPKTPIVAIMDNPENLRKLAFVWGVSGALIPEIAATDDVFQMVESVLKECNRVEHDDLVVITAGIPTLRRGTTNMIKVHRIGSPIERGKRKY